MNVAVLMKHLLSEMESNLSAVKSRLPADQQAKLNVFQQELRSIMRTDMSKMTPEEQMAAVSDMQTKLTELQAKHGTQNS